MRESLVSCLRRRRLRVSLGLSLPFGFAEQALKDVVEAITRSLELVEIRPRLFSHSNVLVSFSRHICVYGCALHKLLGVITRGYLVNSVNRVNGGNFISIGYGGIQ